MGIEGSNPSVSATPIRIFPDHSACTDARRRELRRAGSAHPVRDGTGPQPALPARAAPVRSGDEQRPEQDDGQEQAGTHGNGDDFAVFEHQIVEGGGHGGTGECGEGSCQSANST